MRNLQILAAVLQPLMMAFPLLMRILQLLARYGGVSYWRLSALSCIVPRICEVGSLADVAGTTPDEPAVDSTAGGDAHFSCDASWCVVAVTSLDAKIYLV